MVQYLVLTAHMSSKEHSEFCWTYIWMCMIGLECRSVLPKFTRGATVVKTNDTTGPTSNTPVRMTITMRMSTAGILVVVSVVFIVVVVVDRMRGPFPA